MVTSIRPDAGWTGSRIGGSPRIEDDPLYAAVVVAMQQSEWRQAAGGLSELERRYPDSPQLHDLRHLLSLRLSAEETWRGRGDAPRWSSPRGGVVRALLIANLVVYLLLGAAWLLAAYLR